MTREEREGLIKHLEYDRSIGADYLISDRDVDEIIKALEQEPILDKVLEDIKTEIEECWQMYEDRFDVSDCLDIIDKHISGKAESEG